MSNQTITLNNHFRLSYPDGFHVMDEKEREKLNFLLEGPGEVLTDPERHIMISIGWKVPGGLTSMLVSVKDAAKSMEARVRKPMRSYGYQANGFVTKTVGGENAEGFCYEYEAQGTGMYAESYVLKHKRVFYYLHFYARRKLKDENLGIWAAMLSSAIWI